MDDKQANYLTPYIQHNRILDPVLASALKDVLDRRMYHFGKHQRDQGTEGSNAKMRIKSFIRDLLIYLKITKDNFFGENMDDNTIVSTAYVSASKRFEAQKLNFITPPWMPGLKSNIFFSADLFKKCQSVTNALENEGYHFFLSEDFFQLYKEVRTGLTKFYSNPLIKGGLFANDTCFFEILSIEILRELGKKSFVYLHGIPGNYDIEEYCKQDYLLVWGNKLKHNYVNIGFKEDKIKVVGHPGRKNIPKEVLKNTLENVLVMGSSIPGSQLTDTAILYDRSNTIYYCYLIQDVLSSMGVKKVRFRPHPSESREWYEKSIDLNFFELDEASGLKEAVDKSSLVIGPTSTTVFETLLLGVNYIVFEPFSATVLVPPFDKSDERLLVATTTSELESFLKNRSSSKCEIVKDYMSSDYVLEETILSLI